MPQFLAPICNDQLIDVNGDPLVDGQIETYLAGSTTPAQTYTDDSGAVPQSNPIILNSLGYAPDPIWLTGGVSYKFVIKNAAGVIQRTVDDIAGVNDASVSQSEWVDSGFVPTYINATSFSVPGDQTTVLQIGRRVRTTNTSGLVYSTISNSVFASGITTVTLTNDSTTLDPGLSAVAYGLLAATPLSIPNLPIATETATGVVELATTAEAQAGTDTTRALTPARLKDAQIQLGTAVTASGTSFDFTGIPSYAKRVTASFAGLSTNGNSAWQFTLGTSSGLETSGYLGCNTNLANAAAVGSVNQTGGVQLTNASAAGTTLHGTLILTKLTGNTWLIVGLCGYSDGAANILLAFSKTLAGALDRVRFDTGNATTWDAGTVNITWE